MPKLSGIAVIILFSTLSFGEEKSCLPLIADTSPTELVQNAYASAFRNPDIYVRKECLRNVIRLFHAMKVQVSALEMREFNVLIILDPALLLRTRTRNTIARLLSPDPPPSMFAVAINRAGNPMMNFHVVLEYKGRVFDLDDIRIESVRGMEMRKYFQTFFIQGDVIKRIIKNSYAKGSEVGDLYVYAIPGDIYLNLPLDKEWGLATISPLLRQAPTGALASFY